MDQHVMPLMLGKLYKASLKWYRYGPAVPSTQREAASKAILAVAFLWLLSIVVGGWLHHGMYTPPHPAVEAALSPDDATAPVTGALPSLA